MAGKITVSTINDSSGVLATQNGMTGIAKAWVLYNGVAQTVTNSFNISSITRNSAGNYTVNFTTAQTNANYCVSGSSETGGGTSNIMIWASGGTGATPTLKSTTQCQVLNANNGSAVDCTTVSIIFLGS